MDKIINLLATESDIENKDYNRGMKALWRDVRKDGTVTRDELYDMFDHAAGLDLDLNGASGKSDKRIERPIDRVRGYLDSALEQYLTDNAITNEVTKEVEVEKIVEVEVPGPDCIHHQNQAGHGADQHIGRCRSAD